ncbi:hypothetical protein [Lancefieldella rimae]|uniref:hypothetical protein n=1 Tax=Lancefieldella rimae TaxID=1383 RepID=UPI0028F037E7|nr:hypothetical protein [Lancefieldella rimae]
MSEKNPKRSRFDNVQDGIKRLVLYGVGAVLVVALFKLAFTYALMIPQLIVVRLKSDMAAVGFILAGILLLTVLIAARKRKN